MKTTKAAALSLFALLALGLTACGADPVQSAQEECMAKLTQKAVDVDGGSASDYAQNDDLTSACELLVHMYVTMPLELDEPVKEGEVARVIDCIDSTTRAKLTGAGSQGSFSRDYSGMPYPEAFSTAWVESSC